ncbi:PQQ-dependent sugar dehydrogenase [Sphingobacterium olei]|nr:PQQ-dependent sugar dehydrogenase [Sphingobacterium olei]
MMNHYIRVVYGIFVLFLASCGNVGERHLSVIDYIQLDKTTLKVEVLSSDMDVPWNMLFGSDGFLWVTEQGGTIKKIDPNTGNSRLLLHIPDVYRYRTLGLLSMVLHPDMEKSPYAYIHYTTKEQDSIFSLLVRYEIGLDTLIKPEVLLRIPGNTGHNGSRLVVSPDRKILWATGDAHHGEWAQDTTKYNGKILRLNLDGSIPDDNPFVDSYVWSYGFRNIQGMTFSDSGMLYTSEHGDAIEDEINLIRKGENYGWPVIEGFHDTEQERSYATQHHTSEPLHSWTPVIAPAGLSFYTGTKIPEWKNSLLLATLKTQSLRIMKLSAGGQQIVDEQILFESRYGRLRAIAVSPHGDLFLATSNRDWNPPKGFPREGDDRILKISSTTEVHGIPIRPVTVNKKSGHINGGKDGKQLFTLYCASCHKEDGSGVVGIFPPLVGASQVSDSKSRLLDILMNGLSGKITVKGQVYDQQMPAFSFLKDEEIQQIVNYIRKEFGNNSDSISLSEVKAKRNK